MYFKTLLLFILVAIFQTYAQNIFPEKFEGCNTDVFALESDSTTAKIQDDKILDILKISFDKKTADKIRGQLKLQIIVDLEGNSCLISLENDTNIKTKNLNLKETIDNELKWEKPEKKVAAIIAFRFEKKGVKFKRFGINAKKGAHELVDDK